MPECGGVEKLRIGKGTQLFSGLEDRCTDVKIGNQSPQGGRPWPGYPHLLNIMPHTFPVLPSVLFLAPSSLKSITSLETLDLLFPEILS